MTASIKSRLYPDKFIRIIARRVPWPSLQQRAERSGLRLRWAAVTEDGDLLVAGTEFPLADGAYVLVTEYGVPGDTLVTLRQEGVAHDSFLPVPLSIPAAGGARRAEGKARLALFRACHPENRGESAFSVGRQPLAGVVASEVAE